MTVWQYEKTKSFMLCAENDMNKFKLFSVDISSCCCYVCVNICNVKHLKSVVSKFGGLKRKEWHTFALNFEQMVKHKQ